MKRTLFVFTVAMLVLSAAPAQKTIGLTITKGQMPYVALDKNNALHIVYGRGDSIMYISSKDGRSYSFPSLVAVLPGLAASSMRGPQIAATGDGLAITACDNQGNIFSYTKDLVGNWTKAIRVNEVNGIAKEALMALSADGLNVFAAWLGVSGPKGQAIYGANSADGGRTWTKNILVYASPDGSVCECCKPSVVVKGKNLYVMFRNLIDGNRDMYLIKSEDGGKSFGQATKLGTGSWKLSGCPMDGGGLVVDQNGNPETVWRREEKIYVFTPGMPEKEIGEGRGCTITTKSNRNFYAWSENGNLMLMKPDGLKINLGKGTLPQVRVMSDQELICIWENEKQIHGSIVQL